MQFSLDKFFGVNQQALRIHSQRSETLASNLANADTPGYKARDIDFREALQAAKSGSETAVLQTTHSGHIGSNGMDGHMDDLLVEMKYRVPTQSSLDGNTVDPLIEKSAFMENAIQYQTNLKFLSDKIKHIKSALASE